MVEKTEIEKRIPIPVKNRQVWKKIPNNRFKNFLQEYVIGPYSSLYLKLFFAAFCSNFSRIVSADFTLDSVV